MAARSWARAWILILLAGAWMATRAGQAQSSAGSINIRLTDLSSRPLEGVSVTLRNRTTGSFTRATPSKGGVYHFVGLAPGSYTLDARRSDSRQATLDSIEVYAGQQARMQASVDLQAAPPTERAPVIQSAFTRTETAPIDAQQGTEADGRPTASASIAAEGRAPTHSPLERAALPQPAVSTTNPEHDPVQIARAPSSAVLPLHPQVRNAVFVSPRLGAPVAQMAVRMAAAAMQAAMLPYRPQIDSASSETDSAPYTRMPSDQLQALPLAGTSWQALAPDFAGQEIASDEETEGSAPNMSATRVDDANTRLAFGSMHPRGTREPQQSLMGPASNELALREVSVSSLTGAAIGLQSMNTARGGSHVHGQQSVLTRQSVLGARNPFTQWVQQSAPATATTVPVFTPTAYSPTDREIAWGASLGGPMLHHKIFWFGAVNEFARNAPAVSTVRHPDNFFAQPSNDQMQVLSARLGLSSANPVGVGLNAYSGMLQTLDGLLGPASRTAQQWSGFGRLDWIAGSHRRFTLEGSGALWDSPGGGLSRTSETYGTHSFGSSRIDDQWVLGRWEESVGSHAIARTQISVARRFVAMRPETPSAYEQTLDTAGRGRLPQIAVDSRDGFTIGTPARFGSGGYPDEHQFEVQQDLSWSRPNGFLLRAGFDTRHNDDTTGLLRNQGGTYHYASIENFTSDALAFSAFGLNGQLNSMDQHNCDQTGRVWRDSSGTLHGLGYLPCYAWYSQTMGPSDWWLKTNDWAGFVVSQWRPSKMLTASLGMRWELEQAPPPMQTLNNPDLPLTQHMPNLGSEWGPRASISWGTREGPWPVVRVGYGMHFGRTPNLTFENALTQTGSPKGDLSFFMRPTDNLHGAGAPPFPYVLSGQPSAFVKPGAVEFASAFRNAEVHQAVVSVEQTLPGRVRVEASAVASLGRRLPTTEDANIDPASNPQTITYAIVDATGSGPIKASRLTVPFFASWPSANSSTGFSGRLNANYQRVLEIFSRANSTYEAAVLRVTRVSRDGLTVHARYAYAQTMDWNPSENIGITRPSVFDPTDLREEYGTSDLDVRHAGSVAMIWAPRWKLSGEKRMLANGWALSGVGTFHSGSPYTMRTEGSLAKEFDLSGVPIVALERGINGYGGDNRVYGVGRNTYRSPATWKADLRFGKQFNLGAVRQLELLAESFNLFNHQNTTQIETVGYSIEGGNANGGLPTLNFLTGLKSGQTEFGQPLNINATDFYRPRQIQFGLRMRF